MKRKALSLQRSISNYRREAELYRKMRENLIAWWTECTPAEREEALRHSDLTSYSPNISAEELISGLNA